MQLLQDNAHRKQIIYPVVGQACFILQTLFYPPTPRGFQLLEV